MILEPMQLTQDFYLKEFTRSETAEKKNIQNKPNATQRQNLRSLCVFVLQPLRSFVNRPVKVTSGFRSKKLNEAVGGVPDSFHLDGLAADVTVEDISSETLGLMIDSTSLPVEECITYPDKGHLHVALKKK